jgi:hypothetical protein
MDDLAKDVLRILIEKENTSRSYQQRAQEALCNNNNVPCKEQCMLLQRAAELESDMAEMTVGAEKDHHIKEMNRLDQECASIKNYLEKA